MVIVAAIDRSDRATSVVEEAESLAERFEEPIHVVHAIERSEFIELGFGNELVDKEVDADEVRKAAAREGKAVAESLDVPYETVGLIGEPAAEVVEYAHEQSARYIVVSPKKRSRTGKVLFGSTAQSILLNATCPVVSTRST